MTTDAADLTAIRYAIRLGVGDLRYGPEAEAALDRLEDRVVEAETARDEWEREAERSKWPKEAAQEYHRLKVDYPAAEARVAALERVVHAAKGVHHARSTYMGVANSSGYYERLAEALALLAKAEERKDDDTSTTGGAS